MEETLYNIDIHKEKDQYLGKVYSTEDGIKEFKNQEIETLLRDITQDLQLTFDIFSDRAKEFDENKGQVTSPEKTF